MSRIAKSVSNLLKITLNQRLFANSVQTSGKSLTQLRGISSIVSNNGFNSRHRMTDNSQTTVISKRFAANSPQIDEELTQFLKSEIELEKKNQNKSLPSIDGWNVSTDGSNVVFTKKFGNEEITVRTNVNHSVDTKDIGEDESQDVTTEMVCRPEFSVEIKKGHKVLGINCAFVESEDLEEEPTPPDMKGTDREAIEDEFQINELSLFEGEFKENSYAVAGDVMDGSMYDLMMDLLHERGVDQSFARKLVEYTTVYEHNQYIGLLEKLKDFVSQK